MDFTGTAGDDVITGTDGDDYIDISQGGNDTVSALGGDDVIYVGAALAKGDHIDGGNGFDTVEIAGNYSKLTLDSALVTNVEDVSLGAGFNYTIKIVSSAVAADASLTIDGSALGAGDLLYVDGSHATKGSLTLDGGEGNDTLIGSTGKGLDILNGGDGDDVIDSDGVGISVKNVGAHTIDGGDGNDTIYAGPNDTVQGGDGNDTINFTDLYRGAGNAVVDAGAGDDMVLVGTASFGAGGLQGGTGTDTLAFTNVLYLDMSSFNATSSGFEILDPLARGEISGANTANNYDFSGFTLTANTVLHVITGDGDDVLTGTAGSDWFEAGAGNDILTGNDGNDILSGGAGKDTLNGGLGADTLIGGPGNDTFVYLSVQDSLPGAGNFDVIKNFHEGDKIDLSAIDADTTQSGNQAFHFGGSSFTDTPGELIQFSDGHGHTIVEGDVNGDGVADFEIELNHALVLTTGDFVL
jgi:Ca2+-binding RTX toxin-like protein